MTNTTTATLAAAAEQLAADYAVTLDREKLLTTITTETKYLTDPRTAYHVAACTCTDTILAALPPGYTRCTALTLAIHETLLDYTQTPNP